MRNFCATLLLCASLASPTLCRINSVLELDKAISTTNVTSDPDLVKVGFISVGNYDNVKHLVSSQMTPVYYDNVTSIIDDVVSGNLVAGMSVNRPGNESVIEFGSGAIAVRGFMFKRVATAHTSSIQAAINGAVVSLAESQALRELKQQYYFDFGIDTVEVRTCAGDISTYHAFAEESRNTTITIGRLGPYNWGNLGNYLADPATGFFPDYMSLLAIELKDSLNISLVYKWYPTSQKTMDALEAGEYDCTDMYWTQPALFTHTQDNQSVSVSRSEHFDWSCAVLGTDNVFFTAVPAPPAPIPGEQLETVVNTNTGYSAATIGGIVAGGVVTIVILIVVIVFMVRREKSGNALFAPEDRDQLVGEYTPPVNQI